MGYDAYFMLDYWRVGDLAGHFFWLIDWRTKSWLPDGHWRRASGAARRAALPDTLRHYAKVGFIAVPALK